MLLSTGNGYTIKYLLYRANKDGSVKQALNNVGRNTDKKHKLTRMKKTYTTCKNYGRSTFIMPITIGMSKVIALLSVWGGQMNTTIFRLMTVNSIGLAKKSAFATR